MGLGFDFNPTGVALFRAPKPPSNKASKCLVPSKPLKVQESRFPAAEAKPPTRSNATRASEEAIAQAKKMHAVVSRPLPNVRWIIPGIDNDDGRLHTIQASTGTLDAEDEMRDARQDALDAYEEHMEDRDETAMRIDREHTQREKALDIEVGADKRLELAAARATSARALRDEKEAARKASERAEAVAAGNTGHVTRSSTRLSATLNRRVPKAATPAPAPAKAPNEPAPSKAVAKAPGHVTRSSTRLSATLNRREPKDATPAPTPSKAPAKAPNSPSKAPLSATRVDWSTRENLPKPTNPHEKEDMTTYVNYNIAEAEEALENMPRASRSRTQLENKLEWMKAQKERLNDHEASNEDPSSATAGHQAALRLIGGYSASESKLLASNGFNVLKTASGSTIYKLNGKRSSQAAARKFLDDEEI